MALQGDLQDRAAQAASVRWRQLSWELRLNELRHAHRGVPADEVAVRRAPSQPHARSAEHLSAAS